MAAVEGQAVLLNEAGTPSQLEDITIDAPGPGEVLIRLAASGVCHTDLTIKNQNGSGMSFPDLCWDMRARGTWSKSARGVTNLQVGDPVVIAYRAPCEQCPACRRGRSAPLLRGPASQAAHTSQARRRVMFAGAAVRHVLRRIRSCIAKRPLRCPARCRSTRRA